MSARWVCVSVLLSVVMTKTHALMIAAIRRRAASSHPTARLATMATSALKVTSAQEANAWEQRSLGVANLSAAMVCALSVMRPATAVLKTVDRAL